MLETLRWYLALTAVGALGLLPSLLLFARLRSGGVLYARPLGLLLVSYATWLAAALGAAPYGTPLVIAATLALAAWNVVIVLRQRALLAALWQRRHVLIAGEALFVALFVLIIFVRAQAPAAQHTEKPMDMMLLTAVHSASAMPPNDGWFGGREVSYYHLGHISVDVTARLAAVTPGVAFTLGVATAGALAGAAIFALAGDVLALSRPRRRASVWIAGGVATLSLLMLSTLEGPLELLAANGIGGESLYGPLGVDGLPPVEGATNGVPDGFWWWWRATRILPGTITEFPAFSLILGDLHAHLMALPLAVVALALAPLAFAGGSALTWRSWLARPQALVLAALLYAGLVMTNSWDAVLYGAVWFGAVAATFLGVGWGVGGALFGAARYLLVPAALAALLAWPFLATVESTNLGIEAVREGASDPLRLALIWLPPLLPALAAIVLLRPSLHLRQLANPGALLALAVAAWLVAVLREGGVAAVEERGSGWIVIAALAAGGSLAAAAAARAYPLDRARAAWLALLAAAAAIVLATELVQIDDALGQRFNSVFKFWYGVWLLLALSGGVALATAIERAVRPRAAAAIAAGAFAAIFGAALLYAPAAAISRAREGQPVGIDALAYIGRLDPAQAASLVWIERHLERDDILLEAPVDSYSAVPRLSAASGVPTLVTWPGHEVQWRANGDAVARRLEDARRIFRLGAGEEALTIARRYGVTYIWIGREERRQFGAELAERFAAWPLAFESGDARIVAVPR